MKKMKDPKTKTLRDSPPPRGKKNRKLIEIALTMSGQTEQVLSTVPSDSITNMEIKSQVPQNFIEAHHIAMRPAMALELTQNNHFKFGYDGTPFVFRSSFDQNWWVDYGRCTRRALDWRSECIIAARQIRASTMQNLWVCFSGGIDSQVVAEAFRYAKIPFKAAIMRFKKDLNIHDIAWAVIYCETHGVPYEFFDIDIEEFFLGGELLALADLTQCLTPQLPSSMKLMEMIAKKDGYPILGSAECYLEKLPQGWVMFEREKIAAVYRYLIATETPGQAGFFQWNPEIMYSFLIDPMVRRLVQNQIQNHTSTYYLKSDIYEQYWKLLKRPKYTGFEKIMRLDRQIRPILMERYGLYNQECHIGYTELLNHLEFKAKAPLAKAPSQDLRISL